MPPEAMDLYVAVFLTFHKKRVKMAFPAYSMHDALTRAEEYALAQDNIDGLISLAHSGMEICMPATKTAQKA